MILTQLKKMDTNELNALISLLDDPDESIFEQINGQLLAQGAKVVNEFCNLLGKRLREAL